MSFLSVAEQVFEIVAPLVPEIERLILDPPTPEDEEERAKQIGMRLIRSASDARARAEITGP